jgi:hypothetical protein
MMICSDLERPKIAALDILTRFVVPSAREERRAPIKRGKGTRREQQLYRR